MTKPSTAHIESMRNVLHALVYQEEITVTGLEHLLDAAQNGRIAEVAEKAAALQVEWYAKQKTPADSA